MTSTVPLDGNILSRLVISTSSVISLAKSRRFLLYIGQVWKKTDCCSKQICFFVLCLFESFVVSNVGALREHIRTP